MEWRDARDWWAWAVSLCTVAVMLFMLCWIAVFGGYWAHEPNEIILYVEIIVELSALVALAMMGYEALWGG